jgi:hypothetical protein
LRTQADDESEGGKILLDKENTKEHKSLNRDKRRYPLDTMSPIFKLILVSFVLFMELVFVGLYQPYPHGEVSGVRYRNKERVAAMMDYRFHPSPATEATFQEELRLMHKHEDWKKYLALGILVALNLVGIYYFFGGLTLRRNQQPPSN